MKSLSIVGWKPGFNKVGVNKLLRDRLGYSLADAKTVVEDVLDRRVVVLLVSEELADQLAEELRALAVEVEIRK